MFTAIRNLWSIAWLSTPLVYCLASISVAIANLAEPALADANLGVSPLVVEQQAQRGQASSVLRLSNRGNQPLRVRIYAQPFTYDIEAGFQVLASSAQDLSPYLQFSPRELIVQPGQERQVRLSVLFPPSLADGEYRAVVFSETLFEDMAADGRTAAIEALIGANIYIRHGEVFSELAVENAAWTEDYHQIQLLVRNAGNASALPQITWTLMQGENSVRSGQVKRHTVIAEGARYIPLEVFREDMPALAAGSYQLRGELTEGYGDDAVRIPFSFDLTLPAAGMTASHQSLH